MVLVVDDDLMNIEVMKAMLGQLNVEFDVALQGRMALSLIKIRLE